MKKILSSVVIFSLFFAFGSIVLAQQGQGGGQKQGQGQGQGIGQGQGQKQGQGQMMGEGYEKISSPDQMKNYKSIKKDGNSLFGVPKQKTNGQSNGQNGSNSSQSGSTPQVGSDLEKISSPSDIPLFTKIEKRGNALWGVRKDGGKKYVPVYVTPATAQCVKDAMDKKDAALKASTTKRDASVLAALDARNVCQKNALSQTTAQTQYDANKACVNSFLETLKNANMLGDTEKGVAKTAYVAELKTCTTLQGGTQDILIEDGGDTVEEMK